MWIICEYCQRNNGDFASLCQAFHLLRPNHHRLIPAPEGDWSRLVDLAQVCFPSFPFSGQLRGISMSKHVKTCQNMSKVSVLFGKALLQGTVWSPDLFRLTEYWAVEVPPNHPSLPVASTLEWSGRQATSRTSQLLMVGPMMAYAIMPCRHAMDMICISMRIYAVYA